jgi:hypothetical protein
VSHDTPMLESEYANQIRSAVEAVNVLANRAADDHKLEVRFTVYNDRSGRDFICLDIIKRL